MVRFISIDRIIPDPEQPRKYFDEAEELHLAKSIETHGLLQPILVMPIEDPTYDFQIICGERRYRAHKRLGLVTIKAIIKEMDISEVKDIQLLENVQRSDLSDIELAWEFQRRVDRGQTHRQIAEVIRRNHSYVTQRLGLLKLTDIDQKRMLRGELSFSQARVLLSIKNPEDRRKISENLTKDMSVRSLQKKLQAESFCPVTRVTSSVDVESLAINKLLTLKNGGLKKIVPRQLLITAILEDLKTLRRSS